MTQFDPVCWRRNPDLALSGNKGHSGMENCFFENQTLLFKSVGSVDYLKIYSKVHNLTILRDPSSSGNGNAEIYILYNILFNP